MQHIYHLFDHDATTELESKKFAKILKPGIYFGGLLSHISGDDVEIAPYNMLIRTSTRQITEIEEDSATSITVSESTPYIVATLVWANDVNMTATFSAKDFGSITTDDVVFGEAIYTASVITGINYNNRTWGLYTQDNNLYIDNNANIKGILTCGEDIILPLSIPSSPVEGSCYFDSGTNTLFIYNGIDWTSTILI